MKIKNDLVSLKIGDKQYDFNNLILDEYLKRFVNAQIDKNNIDSYSRELKYCLLKFDTSLNFTSSSELQNKDFDICLVGGCNYSQTIDKKQITIQYEYDADWLAKDYILDITNNNTLKNYYGKKITAIGFNTWINPTLKVCAVLDTSNYNIYVEKKQEISITRRDVITTDTIFYSNNMRKIPGPVHLAPFGVPQIIEQPKIYEDETKLSWVSFNDNGQGVLYSIGLSSYSDYIDKEFVIGQDIQVENKGTEININGLENYLSTDSPLFCSEKIYLNLNLYPAKTNYKYVIFKYKVWQIVHSGSYDNVISTPTDTGYYYYQAIPIEKFGKSNLKIKYERG